eukprot:GHVT01055815.1.p1 GENE.GHVT01055815.1~~GHVT01055815.1.p1  ORF type:complete len:154 (+),score=41.02 GHVT01055815.1:25-462(+)
MAGAEMVQVASPCVCYGAKSIVSLFRYDHVSVESGCCVAVGGSAERPSCRRGASGDLSAGVPSCPPCSASAACSSASASSPRCPAHVGGCLTASPVSSLYEFTTERAVPRVGAMLVGLGGNNGSTFAAGVLANRAGATWRTRRGD